MQAPNELKVLVIDRDPASHHTLDEILNPSCQANGSEVKGERIINTGSAKLPAKFAHLPVYAIDSCAEAFESAERVIRGLKDHKAYALAFIDIHLPTIEDGIATIKALWSLDPDLHIILCTALADFTWEDTIAELGLNDKLLIIKKPFDPLAVRQIALALSRKWQLLKETRGYTNLLEDQIKARTDSLQYHLSISRGTLESSLDGIMVIDRHDKMIDYNKKFIKMWSLPRDLITEASGTAILNYIVSQIEEGEKIIDLTEILPNQTAQYQAEKVKCKSNTTVEFYTQAYLLKNEVAGRIWCFRDISSRVGLEVQLAHQATHDALTQLPNRGMLIQRIEAEIEQAQQRQVSFAIFFFDLDRFKLINDGFSHAVGDEVLKDVAKRVEGIMPEGDILARLGGDEFVGVIAAGEEGKINQVCRQILGEFAKSFMIADHDIVLSTSIGVSVYPRDGRTVDELLSHADLAMYNAKAGGGNQYKFYYPELELQSLERLKCEADLHRAIVNQEFRIVYQPQYDLEQKRFISVEALIRWEHPLRGLILPSDFIPLAEETGLIVPISEWLLETVCKQNMLWQARGFSPIRVAINVGTCQFNQVDFVETLTAALEKSGMAAKFLELELTEAIIINNSVAAGEKIKALRKLGVFVALDDFGTGYSSLNYLRLIQLDRIKIDRSFIQNISLNREDKAIIQAIITLAKNLNLQVLAEGVETKEQLEFLKSEQCAEIQGFYFSKPLDVKSLEVFFKNPAKIVQSLS